MKLLALMRKLFGILVDTKLNFEIHVSSPCKKEAKK